MYPRIEIYQLVQSDSNQSKQNYSFRNEGKQQSMHPKTQHTQEERTIALF